MGRRASAEGGVANAALPDRPRSRKGAETRARLVDAAGEPLPGQPVEVVETFASGSRTRTRGTPLTTDADGYFHARLADEPRDVPNAMR